MRQIIFNGAGFIKARLKKMYFRRAAGVRLRAVLKCKHEVFLCEKNFGFKVANIVFYVKIYKTDCGGCLKCLRMRL